MTTPVAQHLDRLLDMQHSVEAAIVVTSDGLLHAGRSREPEFDRDEGDRLSAGVSALCFAAKTVVEVASRGNPRKRAGVIAVRVPDDIMDGWVLAVPVSPTAWLALYAPDCPDLGLLADAAENFADRVRATLAPASRSGVASGAQPSEG